MHTPQEATNNKSNPNQEQKVGRSLEANENSTEAIHTYSINGNARLNVSA
jgi:hypothetical protein